PRLRRPRSPPRRRGPGPLHVVVDAREGLRQRRRLADRLPAVLAGLRRAGPHGDGRPCRCLRPALLRPRAARRRRGLRPPPARLGRNPAVAAGGGGVGVADTPPTCADSWISPRKPRAGSSCRREERGARQAVRAAGALAGARRKAGSAKPAAANAALTSP